MYRLMSGCGFKLDNVGKLIKLGTKWYQALDNVSVTRGSWVDSPRERE